MDGKFTIHDLDLNHTDDDDNNINVSDDESFYHDEEYQKEFDIDKNGDEDLATDKTYHWRTQKLGL